MNARRSATVKGALLLAVAAVAPQWDVTALFLFLLIRLVGATWEANQP